MLGDSALLQQDPRWRDYVPFYEYFHGDSGRGLGASHQTGWTSLVAKLLDQTSRPAASMTTRHPSAPDTPATRG